MQIKYHGADKFSIKTGQSTIKLDQKPSIDDFVLPGSGEYEKAGISVTGIGFEDNTIYTICSEEINLCYLGNISKEIDEAIIKEIGDIDVLFLPLGENNTLTVKKALLLLSEIDPRVVIPMQYSNLDEFKKSEGISDGETDTFKFKKADLPEEERKIVILKPAE